MLRHRQYIALSCVLSMLFICPVSGQTLKKPIDCNTVSLPFVKQLVNTEILHGHPQGDTAFCNYFLRWEYGNSGLVITLDTIDNNDFKVVTLRHDTLNCFSGKYSKTMIVFANNHCCLACFRAIQQWIENNHPDTIKVAFLVLGRVGMETLGKRNLINSLKGQLPSINQYFFEIQHTDDDFSSRSAGGGVFKKFNVFETPSVLIWNNLEGKPDCFINYEELISKDGLMKESAKEILNTLLVF